MQTYNYYYSNISRLRTSINKDKIDLLTKALVQIFVGKNTKSIMQKTVDSVHSILPNASIISTTTAGEIVEGGVSENTIVVSISIFEDTDVNVKLFEKDTPKNLCKSISDSLITPKTKLLIIFNNLFHNDGESLIKNIWKINPNIIVAGGNAGDNHKFKETFIGINTQISSTAVAVAALDSDSLKVGNGHFLNWNTIGKNMQITKSKESVIYEIDNKPAQDIYRYYLGDDVADTLPNSGIEFPLIFKDDHIEIARAPVAVGDDGSLVMAGHIEQGTEVKFAFGRESDNYIKIYNSIKKLSKNPIESIFIYSCAARKIFFKNHLNDELNMFQQLAPTAGFITYGEFFHNNKNHLLNVTSSYITLNEFSLKSKTVSNLHNKSKSNKTLDVIHHLITRTTQDLEINNLSLKQFESLVKKATIYSMTDTSGIIIDANETFCELSGYTKDELLGKPHNIVRHPNTSKSIFEDLWKTIKSKKIWQGVMENRAKDGSSYFVSAKVFPILDIDENILYYISIRDNITGAALKVKRLEGKASHYEKLSKEKEFLLNQYENVINSSSAFIRVNADFQITYTNDVFCSLFKEKKEDLIGLHHDDIIEPKFLKENKEKITNILAQNKQWSGMVKMQLLNKSVLFLNTTYNAIYDKNFKVIEYMATYHDVTELIKIQEEITKTQADVIFTMGSIGETRSKETGNHVKRVAEYSKELALLYGLGEDEAELLKTASPMHDIGKVGIPDSILNKPGKLTKEEFEIMKTHSTLGFNMLKHSSRPILKAASIVALTHHERWDGKGYPKNLKGKKIPIYGRITAVADVFDALGSDRCYKKAWKDEDVFKLLKEGKQTQFDPKLIDIFFENLDIFLEIRKTFKD